jgi:hypothetical protein
MGVPPMQKFLPALSRLPVCIPTEAPYVAWASRPCSIELGAGDGHGDDELLERQCFCLASYSDLLE